MKKKPNIFLASSSPRRQAMFRFFNIDFTPLKVEFDETFLSSVPESICLEICQKKMIASHDFLGEEAKRSIVVVADTLVFLNEQILGKPKDKDEAFKMLSLLSGKQHSVITAVGYSNYGEIEFFHEKTLVKFVELSSEMIENYLDRNDYHDKAGSYAIQSDHNFFVEKIEGSYTNVVGFPMESFLQKCKGISI